MSFWDDARHVVNSLDPIVKVLWMVDGDKTPTMGALYEAIRLMRETIKSTTPRSCKWILNIVDRRWMSQLCRPLHQGAYFLNPLYQYKHQIGTRSDLIDALNQVIAKLLSEGSKQAQALSELKFFRDAVGSFRSPAAQSGIKNTHPAEWWNLYGSSAPNLRSLAIKILSQTASSSGCERNWSTFGLIHTKQRNRLGHERLQKSVFVHYNMRLRAKYIRTDSELGHFQDPIDLTEIFSEEGDENPLYEWVKDANQTLMDEPDGRPSSYIAAEMGVDVDRFMATKVNAPTTGYSISSISDSETDGDDDNNNGHDDDSTQAPDDDDDDGEDDDNDDDSDGGNVGDGASHQWSQGQRQQQNERHTQSQVQMSPFTGESQYDHSTQDADHGSRSSSMHRQTYGRKRHGHTSGSKYTSIHNIQLAMGNMSIEDDTEAISSSSSSYGYPRYQQEYNNEAMSSHGSYNRDQQKNISMKPTGRIMSNEYQGSISSESSSLSHDVRPTGWVLPHEYQSEYSRDLISGGIKPAGWTEYQDHHSGRPHGHTHDSAVSSVNIVSDGLLDLDEVDDWLERLIEEKGEDLYRMKGILSISGSNERYVFQGVHSILDGSPGKLWGSDEKRQNKLVFIGRNLDEAALRKGFKGCLV